MDVLREHKQRCSVRMGNNLAIAIKASWPIGSIAFHYDHVTISTGFTKLKLSYNDIKSIERYTKGIYALFPAIKINHEQEQKKFVVIHAYDKKNILEHFKRHDVTIKGF